MSRIHGPALRGSYNSRVMPVTTPLLYFAGQKGLADGEPFHDNIYKEWRARQRTPNSLSTWGPNGKRRFSVCWLIRPSYLWSVIGSGGLWPLCPQLVDNFLLERLYRDHPWPLFLCLQMSFHILTTAWLWCSRVSVVETCCQFQGLYSVPLFMLTCLLTIPLVTFIFLKLSWRMGRSTSDNIDHREMGSQGEAIP